MHEDIKVRSFTLPDDEHLPAELAEGGFVSSIASAIGRDFWPPIVETALRQAAFAAFVAVPVAAVDEQDLTPPRKYDIGGTGQIPEVEAISVAEPVEHPPHDHFRTGVPCAYRLHDLPTLRGTPGIRHREAPNGSILRFFLPTRTILAGTRLTVRWIGCR